jgi:integrase
MPLTDTRIRQTKKSDKPQKLTDGGGLYLEVRPSGAKLWRYRYRIGGKENVFAAGEYAEPPARETPEQTAARQADERLTLQEARIKRVEWRALVKQGVHPSHSRKARSAAKAADNANTFEAVAREWIADRSIKKQWTPYYLKQVERFMETDVYPHVGKLAIRGISAAQMLEILTRVGKRAPTVALLLRQWCSGVFSYAVSTLRADGDPMVALKAAVTRPKVEHRKPLARADIPGFLKKVDEAGGYRTTAIALRLLLLTWVRPIELRGAQWPEFDLDAVEWRIPGERMKMREPHIVPLSTQAVELLRELQKLTGGGKWLFPNYRRPETYMTGTTMNRALERMGYAGRFSSHGFRSTASTILNELGYDENWIERQLAHGERNKSRAAYNRAQHLPERRQMMQEWADLIDGWSAGKNVVPIKGKVA